MQRQKLVFDKTLSAFTLDNKPIQFHYNSSKKLGEGEFAVVYHGIYRPTNVEVAIKIQHAANDLLLAMYEREIDIMRKLTGAKAKNVVHMYGCAFDPEQDGYRVSIAMTYATNGSLDKKLVNAELNFEEKIQISYGIVNGLSYMHSLDILHNDMKPQNVLLDKRNFPMLCDFGFSKRIGIDNTNTINGTPVFLSPALLLACFTNYEAQQGKEDDIYSLSLVIYCIFADKDLVFQDKNARQLITAVCHADERPSMPFCPPQVVRLIQSAWSSNPKSRPTADQALKILSNQPIANQTTPSQANLPAKKTRERAKSVTTYLTGSSLFSTKETSFSEAVEKKSMIVVSKRM